MERSKYILLILLVSLRCTLVQASHQSLIFEAYNTGAKDDWEAAIIEMDKLKPKSNAFVLELLNYQYGYIAWCVGANDEKKAEKYIELAGKNIDYLLYRKYQIAKMNVYMAAFCGFKMGLDSYRAPFLGAKSESYINSALAFHSGEPRVYIQKANSLYYMPAAFGGSKTELVGYYRKALGLMEDNKQEYRSDWNYLNLMVIIGITYAEREDYQEARLFYLMALEVASDLWYGKQELYPDLIKKMNNEL